MNQTILKRVFLFGCPRSGTTLLQSLVAANSSIASFPESHFYEALFSRRRLLSAFGFSSRRVRSRWNLFLEEIGHPELKLMLPKYAILPRQYSNAFVKLLDRLTLEQGKSIWLEKTPGHLNFIDQIEELVKDIRFVHILRNGGDNIASLFEMVTNYPETWGRWNGSIDECIQRWIIATRTSLRYFNKENHHLVRYEQLVANPKSVLIDLCEFIGVQFEEKMMSDYSIIADQLILKREPWKASVKEPIWTVKKSKFNDLLNEEQRLYILAHIPNDLLDFIIHEEQQVRQVCGS